MARPRFLSPMVATLVDELPRGADWAYEVKLDGYRALMLKDAGTVRVRSRNDKDLTHSYPGVAAAASRLAVKSAVLDGEIVAVDAEGHPSFQALQNRSSFPLHSIAYDAFDLLHLDGADLTRLPLEQRKARLEYILRGSSIPVSPLLPGSVSEVVEAVPALGLEGVIAKRRSSRYDAGVRSQAWLKLKLDRQQEFVIGGYRPGAHGVDALLVGCYDGAQLEFAGKVRAGFTPHLRREVCAALAPLRRKQCPFVDLPNSTTTHWGGGVTVEQMAEMQWVAPRLVAQIRFVEWTADDHLRHAAFLGLRHDKDPRRVRRER